MRIRSSQSGVAHLGLVLIIIILVGVVGFSGWYVGHRSKPTNTAASTVPNTSQKYFTIKEWGVRAPYSGNLTLEYTLRSNYAYFSSVELDSSDVNCQRTSNGGFIIRYSASDPYLLGDFGTNSGKTAAQYASTLQSSQYGHVGNYYFFGQSAQGLCGQSQASEDLQGQTAEAVKSIVTHLQAVPSQ